MAAKLNQTGGRRVSRWLRPWVVLLLAMQCVDPVMSRDLDRVMPETFWESELLGAPEASGESSLHLVEPADVSTLEGSSQSRTIAAAVPEATPVPASTLSDEDVALLNRVERAVEAFGPENVASTEWNKLLNDDTLPAGAACCVW